MSQPSCDRCCFCAHSPYLVCALHPVGPDCVPCPDFEESQLKQWQPLTGSDFYDNWVSRFTQATLSDDWTRFWTAEEGSSNQ